MISTVWVGHMTATDYRYFALAIASYRSARDAWAGCGSQWFEMPWKWHARDSAWLVGAAVGSAKA